MSIINQIKQIRLKAGKKQTEVCALVNMHQSNYSKAENGKLSLSTARAEKIIDYLGYKVEIVKK